MQPPQRLHQLGQSLWLDAISHDLVTRGALERYVGELGVTGLTSNPTIFDEAFLSSNDYDGAIVDAAWCACSPEEAFTRIALADIRAAAEVLLPIHEATDGRDGWVSFEISPELAYNPDATVREAIALHARAALPNLFVKIPGTAAALPAIEETTFAGVPVNVTLLFGDRQYRAACDAYLRGLERRVEAGRDPVVRSVASVFVSRWDVVPELSDLPPDLRGRVGLTTAWQVRAAHNQMLRSRRWQSLAAAGARPQRLLWASTATKDPYAPDTYYVDALAERGTIDTVPERTLLAFADHGSPRPALTCDGQLWAQNEARLAALGVDLPALGDRLQQSAALAFRRSWRELLDHIEARSIELLADRRAA